jgi:hypothetical protein
MHRRACDVVAAARSADPSFTDFREALNMLRSHVIEIDGAFVGAAVRLDTGYRFIATDIRMEELDGTTWPSLADVRRLANQLFRTGGFTGAVP